MCTQELIWCSCGHGEFLEIQKCRTAHATGRCWTVVHGNHHLIVPAVCSYCRSGLNRRWPLGSPRPMPGEEVAGMVEGNGQDVKGEDGQWIEEGERVSTYGVEDVMSTDWSDFGLEREMEMWRVDPFLMDGNGSGGGGLGSIPEEGGQ